MRRTDLYRVIIKKVWPGVPDYKGEELAYKMALETFEKHGRIVNDTTINGKLDVFEKVDYNSLFKK